MKYKCINEFIVPRCDDDCFDIEGEYFHVLVGSLWELGDDNMIGGEVHLDCVEGSNEFTWVEIPNEDFKENFVGVQE